MGRHATSKLRTVEDLFDIRTMGFRGEALPTIASVSRFRLSTAAADAREGVSLVFEGGHKLREEPCPPVRGTTVSVEDLFFNTPARRKFLKREETEVRHCLDAALRLCLAHPDVGFVVEHDGRTLLSTPASGGDLSSRAVAALGPQVAGRLWAVDERRLGCRVTGFIASPELTQSSARGVYTFVNRRYVRDRGLNYALQRALHDALAPGRHPLAVLFLEVDPKEVDVNVHPQKLEVRFADPAGVQQVLSAGVMEAVRASRAASSAVAPSSAASATPQYASAVERFLSRAQTAVAEWSAPDQTAPAFGQARPDINRGPPPGYFGALRLVGALGGRFWVCEGGGGSLLVVDPHAARERAHLSELSASLASASAPKERSLFSAQVELPRDVVEALLPHAPALERLGLSIERFGESAVAVRAVPDGLERTSPRDLLEAVAAALPSHEAVLRSLACRAAAAEPSNEPLHREFSALMESLDRADFDARAEHEAIVVLDVPLLELDRKAK
jgi:DNA mismatch repair protein MutL